MIPSLSASCSGNSWITSRVGSVMSVLISGVLMGISVSGIISREDWGEDSTSTVGSKTVGDGMEGDCLLALKPSPKGLLWGPSTVVHCFSTSSLENGGIAICVCGVGFHLAKRLDGGRVPIGVP